MIFMRTIDSFEDYVEPIDEVINDIFLPVLCRQREHLPDELRELFTLPLAQGGLGIPDLKAEVSLQYAASNIMIAPHVAARLVLNLIKYYVFTLKTAEGNDCGRITAANRSSSCSILR